MKTLAMSLLFLCGASAHAFEANCKVTEMYDSSYLEESLSLEEYPDVTLNAEEVYLGSSHYSLNDGDSITLKPSVGFEKTIEITDVTGEQKFTVTVNNLPTNKTGELWGQNKGEEASKIADLLCQ